MKRNASLILILVLLLSFAGVSSAEALPFKIAVITGTVSQGEEEYQAGLKVAELYPGSILHVTYPDNFMQEQETVIGQIVQFAMDPEVKGIVVAQAVPGTTAAFKQVREFRDDIILYMGEPHEDPDIIAEVVDIALNADDLVRGFTIVEVAAQLGAKKILHYSFPRHMSMELLAVRRANMGEAAKELGIEIIDVTAPDPMGDAGIPGTQQFILEDIPRQAQVHGKDIAFFGTNCAMQEPSIRASLDAGIIHPEQCCPGPYHGYPGALGIEIPEDKQGDVDFIIEQIREKIAAEGGTGRFATWGVAVKMLLVEAGVDLIVRHIQEGLDFDDLEAVEAAISECMNATITLSRYSDGSNYYLLIADSIVF